MDLSKTLIKAKQPCASGFRWFLRAYSDSADYQALLDALVHEGRIEDALWLLDQFGPTDAVLELDTLEADALVFSGSVHLRGDADVGGVLRVGRSLNAAAGVRAAGPITIGEDLRTAGSIRSEAHLRVGGDLRTQGAVVAGQDIAVGGTLRCHLYLQCDGAVTVAGEAVIDDDLAAADHVRVGASLQVRGRIAVCGDLLAERGIRCDGDIDCGRHLEAGWGIRTQGSMRAGGAIRAGESLLAEGSITSGNGYGVYAGLSVARDTWSSCARVVAIQRPAQLMSGEWSAAATAADAAPHHPSSL